MTTQPPASAIAIHSADDDTFAPHAVIGYVVQLDYPKGHWAALYVDYETGDVRRWSKSLASVDMAESYVRTDYHQALPRLRDEAAEWAAGYRTALARAARRERGLSRAGATPWLPGRGVAARLGKILDG